MKFIKLKTAGISSLAVVLIGSVVGGMLFINPAFADSKISLQQKIHALTASRNSETATKEPVVKLGGNLSVKDIAALLGMNWDTFLEEMKKGKSLAQLAQEKGINQDDLIRKMRDEASKKYDVAVKDGKMKQAQADKLKSGLSEQLKKMMGNVPKNEPKATSVVNDRIKVAATILGIEQQALIAELRSGRSLRQIAFNLGINEDDLLNKFVDMENRNIEDALKAGKINQTQADNLKNGLKDRLKVFLTRRTITANAKDENQQG
jgi:polyhydroxyalkanoate synthesis regulator phasin